MFSKDLKVYIIGNIPSNISNITKNKFIRAQERLEKFGVEVYNPIISLINTKNKRKLAIKYNYKLLLDSDAVYILSDAFQDYERIPEIKIALKLDLIIMHELKDITENSRKKKLLSL